MVCLHLVETLSRSLFRVLRRALHHNSRLRVGLQSSLISPFARLLDIADEIPNECLAKQSFTTPMTFLMSSLLNPKLTLFSASRHNGLV